MMQGFGHPAPVRVRHATRAASKGRRTRCKCGQCQQCLEDARWERIFVEKFADPNYYNGPVTHTTSPPRPSMDCFSAPLPILFWPLHGRLSTPGPPLDDSGTPRDPTSTRRGWHEI